MRPRTPSRRRPTALADLVLSQDVFEIGDLAPEGRVAGDGSVGVLHAVVDELGAVPKLQPQYAPRVVLWLKESCVVLPMVRVRLTLPHAHNVTLRVAPEELDGNGSQDRRGKCRGESVPYSSRRGIAPPT